MMTLINGIMMGIAEAVILVMIISWFCGIYFFLRDIAVSAKEIVTALEKITKEHGEHHTEGHSSTGAFHKVGD